MTWRDRAECIRGCSAQRSVPSRITLALHPGYGTSSVSPSVNLSSRKYSTLPKFGNGVCVAHPGSSLRGDLVVVTFASRACGGRGSVRVREAKGRADCSPRAQGFVPTSGAARLRLVCKFPAPSTGLEKLRRNGGPCVRQNRVVLAVVATVKPWRMRHLRQPARCR